MDTYKQICAKLVEAWDDTADGEYEDFGRAASYLVDWTRAELAEPEPEGLTVQEISNLPQHGENYIAEDRDGEIQLDGYFSRADLQQLADSIPTNRINSNA